MTLPYRPAERPVTLRLGVRGTPTFFINGRKVVGAVPFEMFKAVIDDELAKAEAMGKAGTPPREV